MGGGREKSCKHVFKLSLRKSELICIPALLHPTQLARRQESMEMQGVGAGLISHALCCCYRQWRHNRRVPEGFSPGGESSLRRVAR